MLHECLAERDLGCSSPCSENTARKTLQPLSDDDMKVCLLVTIGALVSLAALAGTVQGSKRPPQGPGPTATRPSTEAAGGVNTGDDGAADACIGAPGRRPVDSSSSLAAAAEQPTLSHARSSPPHLTYPAGPHPPMGVWPTQPSWTAYHRRPPLSLCTASSKRPPCSRRGPRRGNSSATTRCIWPCPRRAYAPQQPTMQADHPDPHCQPPRPTQSPHYSSEQAPHHLGSLHQHTRRPLQRQ